MQEQTHQHLSARIEQEKTQSPNLHKDYFAKIMVECSLGDVVKALNSLTERVQKKHRRQAFLMACEKGRVDIVKWFIHEAPQR